MTSGAKTVAERLLVAGLLVVVAGRASAFEVDELMALLARRGEAHALFVEQRYLPGLAQPVVSTGRLDFEPPDRYTRHTLTPHVETLAIAGNRLTLTRDGHARNLMLDAAPEAALGIDAVRATLTGDAATLEHGFKPTLVGSAADWQLTLVPLDPRAAGNLVEVRVVGRRDALAGLEMRMADGTRTVTTLTSAPSSTPSSEPASAPAP
ncbi:MAG TPA: LolA-related protein [Burkholderiaceae bacterium]|nr:LolA-related protein [Burkholderiaceae bacterium]